MSGASEVLADVEAETVVCGAPAGLEAFAACRLALSLSRYCFSASSFSFILKEVVRVWKMGVGLVKDAQKEEGSRSFNLGSDQLGVFFNGTILLLISNLF